MSNYDSDLFCELVGYVSREPCTCELAHPEGRPCLSCRARENYEAHKEHLREAEAVPKKRVVFEAEEDALGDKWVARCADLVDDFTVTFNSALERVLEEIGPERVASILYPPPPNPSMKRQIVGHDGELLGEVWIEWPDPRSDKREITVKGRYSPVPRGQ